MPFAARARLLALPFLALALLPARAEEPSACKPAPLAAATLYLRGSMNNWGVLDNAALEYRCDAYYVNVKALGRQEFKLADSDYRPATTVGSPMGAATEVAVDGTPYRAGRGNDAGGVANLTARFSGEHTLRLAFDDAGRPQVSIGPKSFVGAAAAAAVIDDPVAQSLVFDSRAAASKTPFGAVPAGTKVAFRLGALPGVSKATLVVELRSMEGNQENLRYTAVARIPMKKTTARGRDTWAAAHTFAGIGVYGYYFEVESGARTWILQNNDDQVYWTREAGTNGIGSVAARPAQAGSIRRFRQTVYRPDFRVPAWARDAVIYQIFPDRFRNGDAGNDPRPGVDAYQDRGVEFHRNWLDRPYRPGSGDGSDDSHNNDFFGGDLAGIIDKLDYLRDLGADTLYLTPIFRAASNHKYDTADYRNVDPHFGTNADFTRLTQEAKRRGLRVIVDTSFNHTGTDSIYFDRYGHFGKDGAFTGGQVQATSPYADWYLFDAGAPRPEQRYKGWVGVSDLPELNKMSPSFRRFAYEAPDSVTRLWLRRGASAWRMDVAPWVPDDFWRGWRKVVKQQDPQALTIGEIWFDASKFLLGDTFDSTMNYVLRNAVLDYAAGADARIVYRNVELLREAYPPQAFYALMNLLSSHDQPRALYHLGYQSPAQGLDALALAKRRLHLAMLFQMTFPGAPSVYYGDEVGVGGGEDPDNRATYPWADLGGQPDERVLADTRALIKLRRAHPVLRRGSLGAPLLVDRNVIALARQDGAHWALVLTNNADEARSVTLALPAGMRGMQLTDKLSGRVLKADGASLQVEVPALSGAVLVGTAGSAASSHH